MDGQKKLPGNEASEQPSLSDIDFNPQQKLMNNYFTSMKDEQQSEMDSKSK